MGPTVPVVARRSSPAPYLPACECDADSLTAADRTVELVSKAPRAEIKRYPIGHFDIYVGEWWERAVADQTDFLSRHLLKREPSLTH